MIITIKELSIFGIGILNVIFMQKQNVKRLMISVATYRPSTKFMEHPDPITVTVPDDHAYTVRQLFERSAVLSSLTGRKPGVYDPAADFDSDDLEKINQMEMSELAEIRERMRSDIKSKEDILKDLKKNVDAKRRKAIDEYEASLVDRVAKRKEEGGKGKPAGVPEPK